MVLLESSMIEFIKKWWKAIAGFLGALFLLFYNMRKKRSFEEFHENSKDNLEAEVKVEKEAAEKAEAAREEIDKEFFEAKDKLASDIKNKKKNLDKQRKAEEKEIKADSPSKKIADAFGAKHVEIED